MANIDSQDVLFYSVMNQALAHLPYMIVLDRTTKYDIVLLL